MMAEENIYSQFIESIVSSVPVGIVTVNTELRIASINRIADKMMEIKHEKFSGSPLEALLNKVFSSKDSSRLIEAVKRTFQTAKEESLELGSDKLKERIIVNTTASPLISSPHKIMGAVIVFDDITELKRVEEESKARLEELERSYAELEEGRDVLVRSEKLAFAGRMAASVAHEIRNPLTNVSMSVQQLKGFLKSGERGDKDVETAIDVTLRNTERLNYLITELINSARPPELSLRHHNIHELLEDVLESNKTKISSKKINIVKRFTSKPSKLSMDKEQMERAFSNIIINGIESMRRGGKLTIVTQPDEKVFTVKIQDTGKGIPEEDIIRIFDPFFSSKSDGVGLGLTICYGVIVSHGGTIDVESEPKKGSVFTVTLPMGRVLKKKKKKKTASTGWKRAK